MANLDLNKPVQKPTYWVNRLVVIEKPNRKLRVCLDPRLLNKTIKRKHLHLSTAEKIYSHMSGVSYFSKLDASSGHWPIGADNQAQTYDLKSIKQVKFFRGKLLSIISDIPGILNSQDEFVV